MNGKKNGAYSKPLRLSIIEGMFASIMYGGAYVFVIPFAIFLGASSLQVGYLLAFPALFAALIQLGSMKLLSIYKKRKDALIVTVFLEAISWLLIAAVPFVFPESQILWLTIILTIGTVIGSIGTPLWQS